VKLARRQHAPPYRLLSLLLQYPDTALLDARASISNAIEALPRSKVREALERFLKYFGEVDATAAQQHYVETFDLQRRSSLYLTFFTHGDTRARGRALLALKRLYRSAGLELEAAELPDYLPVVLEFAAAAPPEVGRRLLAEHRHALELIRAHLTEAASPYRHLLDAVCAAMPRLDAAGVRAVARLASEGPPAEHVGLEPFVARGFVPQGEGGR
jgi:nitrate reductase molybdenum cofactor assembly chaperone NarJ/NarW